ncbi:Protein STE5 [Cytospora mali]|uniref:Protein STE5 n=1 Tax=Cytospora mali TaxID=578113 RepID=A0A194V7H0_CYTMA|nr:Protein STE5 [Valsa mali var. pyri (nom. inval.)]
MFHRSHTKQQGFAKEQRIADAQLASLRQLGLISPDKKGFASAWGGTELIPSGSAARTEANLNNNHTTSRSSQFGDFNGGPSFPEKGHSIAAGTLRAPSHRSSISNGSNRPREPVIRPNTTSNFGMMSVDRTRTRRERTFVGSECAVCEEPLEHTLRGERILQFSCSHVSHEACFYEFIREFESQYCPSCNAPLHLDTSRGGNVLDIGMSEVFM